MPALRSGVSGLADLSDRASRGLSPPSRSQTPRPRDRAGIQDVAAPATAPLQIGGEPMKNPGARPGSFVQAKAAQMRSMPFLTCSLASP